MKRPARFDHASARGLVSLLPMSRWSVIGLLVLSLAACGDDDAATTDAGGDAAVDDAGDSGGFIPRRDSSVIEGDPVPTCDRLDPLACGAGQKCAWVLRFVDAQSAEIYTGCVDEQDEREPGVPCEQWGRFYEAEGLTQDVLVDPCVEGSFCGADPKLRDVYTCQPLCATGRDCDGSSYCGATSVGGGASVRICQPSDDCDGVAQTGCRTGEACYLRPNGLSDGALAVCLTHTPQSPVIGAPGDQCLYDGAQYLSACMPGSVCWGSPRLTPDRWSDTEIYCRSYCDPMEVPTDADAGNGTCGTGTCVWMGDPALGLNVSALTSVPGICD